MYITKHYSKTSSGKSYLSVLLRESYRENGKVKNRTLANLKNLPEDVIQAIEIALKHKDELSALLAANIPEVQILQGKSVGDLLVVKQIAEKLGITEALGTSFEGQLALWQVMARVVGQGSRLSSTRLAAEDRDAASVLQLSRGFDENDLYKNLAWLADNQTQIEDKLFQKRYKDGRKPTIFLYDVTSSYLEGTCNELSEFGYNRDRKKGKKQIVIGLLCDEEGNPLSTQVFRGNTQDSTTVSDQIKKVAQRFDCNDVTFVGDRGMIKKGQIDALQEFGFHYITAITKPQVETMLKNGTIEMGLFDKSICEITDGNVRYILRKNPTRANEIKNTREQKMERIEFLLAKENEYLKNHFKASLEKAIYRLQSQIKRLKCQNWLSVSGENRILTLSENAETLSEEARLDGCYVIKTDLSDERGSAQTIHDRYKELALVEWAFRTEKTTHLEVRPLYVHREKSTYGHVFVVMLAYMIVRHLAWHWGKINLTVEEGLGLLSKLSAQELHVPGRDPQICIPTPTARGQQLLDCLGIQLPKTLSMVNVPIKARKAVRKGAK